MRNSEGIEELRGATDRRVQRVALSQIRYSGNKAIELSTFKHFFLTGRKVQIKSVKYLKCSFCIRITHMLISLGF